MDNKRYEDWQERLQRVLFDGATVMVGGFGRGGTPFTLLEYLSDIADYPHDLTVVKNDGNEPTLGLGPLIKRGMIKKMIATHIGLNPDLIARMNKQEVQVEFFPQGIFAEKIRAAGSGIPAFLHDIGVCSEVTQHHQRVMVGNNEYLIEPALGGDVALLYADKADTYGNLWWRGSNRNMNPLMGTACKKVFVEADELVDNIAPEDVQLPGIYVDVIVPAASRRHMEEQRHG